MKNGARYMRPDSRDPRKMVETRFNYCLTQFCHRIIDRKKNRSPYCPHCKFVLDRDLHMKNFPELYEKGK